ncbi:MAG: T9SS type A sorting domain-containing protein [Flavobacteriales bacterium]|nr:T9SS type A sorting domain-containing protein [Flavobacteriales bacterium]
MEIRVLTASLIAVVILSPLVIIEPENPLRDYNNYQAVILPLFSETPLSEGGSGLLQARVEWQHSRLADPATGEIPIGMRKLELAFARNLEHASKSASSSNPEFDWKAMGPHNVGGRTRAFAIDVTNENVMLAGGVTGGLWRSIDAGTTWTEISFSSDHPSITSIVQDTRVGKTNIWYFGTGEAWFWNSASKNFSAYYAGNGMYKSTDGGLSWDTIAATVSDSPEKIDPWDNIWRVEMDPSVDSVDILYAALNQIIYRSTDDGDSWAVAINGSDPWPIAYCDVKVSATGITYATLSTSNNAGIWRSGDHGATWSKISANSGWPSYHDRIVIGINPSNENEVYFLASTEDFGQLSQTFFGGTDWNSLWKYEYLTGNGADTNGTWTDLSNNIPAGGPAFNNFNSQGSYNLVVAVKPDDPNTVFIGGTNLYRSTDGFSTSNNTTQIGGYQESTVLPYFQMYPNHHPDNHSLSFLPSNPDILFSSNDGGIFRTDNSLANSVSWTPLNNGYRTTQFYTIAVDKQAENGDVVFGGLQDNGTFWTSSSDPLDPWVMPSTGDGAYCAVGDDGTYYFSRQNGKVLKATLDSNGTPTAFNRMDPITTDTATNDTVANYLFINPFILDPADNNIMYLPEKYDLWRNDDLASIPLDNEYDSISTGWTQLTNIDSIFPKYITTLSCSESNPEHRLYYGALGGKIYRIDNANTGNPPSADITSNIALGFGDAYVSCLAIDPRDADKVLAVYSNYKIYSLWYTVNGGTSWDKVAGNLEHGPPGLPLQVIHLGDGPSCRWASIIPIGSDSTLFMLGTSTGLYTTYSLIPDSTPGDSTQWIPQAAATIGNAIVDMIDWRRSDGFIAIGTHGSGVYTTRLEMAAAVENLQAGEAAIKVIVFPNPANTHTSFGFELKEKSKVTISIYDSSGRKLEELGNSTFAKGTHRIEYNTSGLRAGIYLYSLATELGKVSGRLVIN